MRGAALWENSNQFSQMNLRYKRARKYIKRVVCCCFFSSSWKSTKFIFVGLRWINETLGNKLWYHQKHRWRKIHLPKVIYNLLVWWSVSRAHISMVYKYSDKFRCCSNILMKFVSCFLCYKKDRKSVYKTLLHTFIDTGRMINFLFSILNVWHSFIKY